MTFSDYQAIPAINATAIKAGVKSMLHMRAVMTGKQDASTTATRWGRLFHGAVLEPSAFFKRVSVWEGARRGKAWDVFEAAHDPEYIITKIDDKDEQATLFAMSQAIHADPDAHRILSNCENEKTVQWSGEYGAAKCRMDGFSATEGVIELKTTRDITRFWMQFISMRYDVQCGWYTLGAESSGMCSGACPCVVIAIESAAPFAVSVYRVPSMALAIGRRNGIKTAVRYRQCEAAGVYPGFTSGITELPLPDYYSSSPDAAGCFPEMSTDEL